MGWGLILLWIVIGGTIMFNFRDKVKAFVSKINLGAGTKFVLFATILALIEEAITTTMTNLAPLFGVKIGQAYITASTNYLDVVGMHSVISFIPGFIVWAWLLKRYNFSPFAVFLLFGISGTLAETSFGLKHLAEFGLWIFVYGLMVYLPAYSFPENRGASPPKLWHYLLAIFLPGLFTPITGWIPFVLDPHHPKIHFPPLSL